MYKKYKLKGLDSVEDIKSLEEYISLYQGVIHCSINKHILFIDTKTKISEQDLNKYINQYNNKVSILLKTDSHEHKEYYSCGNEHTHHSECNCGHYHEHKEDQRSLNQSHKFIITGLDCANCAMKVEKAINNLDYVEEAVLNFTTLTLYVKSDEKDLMNKLQSFVDKIESGVVISQDNDIVLKPQLFNLKEHKNIIIGIVLLIISLCLSHKIISFIFVLSAYLIIGYPVLSKAYRNILKGQIFDENFLMCIATIGALIIGEYFEAVAVMLFYSIGEIIQSYAVNKTRTSITQLMDIKSDYANVLENGKIVVKDPADVNCGEVIVVKVGEKIPVDGIVVKGHSSLDTSSLTGESLPKDIGYNDEVLAGMINLTEVIYIRVIRPFKDSAVAKIIDLMENAASKKAPLERFITRFARIYTPIVCIMALLLVLIPMLVFEDASFHTWLYRSLTFLVVSCPCALVVSIPLGLYAGLGKASQLGALIKGGNYLEYLKNIDTVVFDKTGTLTKGTFSVKNIQGDHQLLEIAAYCESMSNHPISKSITSYYNQSIDYNRLSDYKEIAGKGIQCRFDGIMYYLGNKTYMNQLGISIKQTDIIGTAVYISKENQYLGCIIVDDEIKESAIKGLKHLKEAGITHTVMLTGDKHNVALKIAEKLNIDTVYSELLPQDKVLKVEELLKEHKVIFAGDGINDAPVLSRAHIGIAMGGVGSDAAIEAADIVLMNDNIDIIGDIIQLSKRTNRILKQNVIFTLFIKISVLILTMFGYSNMWMGVFADVGVALIAIMNSMRILK